jgi:hypothetical protein
MSLSLTISFPEAGFVEGEKSFHPEITDIFKPVLQSVAMQI